MITTAIFDLDNTLICGDSDYLWGEYMIETGMVGEAHAKANRKFMCDYDNGTLDTIAFLRFQLAPLTRSTPQWLAETRARFLRERIEPLILRKAVELIESHRRAGHELLIATATNDFITAPIASMFAVDHLVATQVEQNLHGYTGEIVGVPCMGEGKREKVHAWLSARSIAPRACIFYSDSRNDIPLLETVGEPVAVDPDPHLRAHAHSHGWRIISLR